MENELNTEPSHYEILFRVRRAIRYHSRLQKHYRRLHNWMLFTGLCLSSTAIITSVTAFFTAVGQGWTWLTSLPAALMSVLWITDHVSQNVQKTGLHKDFVRRYTDLERRLVAPEGKSPAVVAEVFDKVLQLEEDEPPVLHVLNILCRNELMRAEGFPQEQQIPVKTIPRLFAGFTDLGAY